MMALAVLAGHVVVGRVLNLSANLLFAMLTAIMMTGFADVVNDIADLRIDIINEPNRPLPSKRVSVPAAKVFSLVLLSTGLLSAFLTGTVLNIGLALIAGMSAAAYDFLLKSTGLFGNTIVSLLVALPFLYGAALWPNWLEITLFVLFATAFVANLGREIQKGIIDVNGDRERRISTVAVTHGIRTAGLAASAFYILAVCFSVIPPLLRTVSLIYLPLILLVDLGFLRASIRLLKPRIQDNMKKEKNLILIWMALAELAFIAGRYSGW
jgi:geranylgeranylglycerol-phosphate geranylgeranyltransferase